MTNEVKHPEIHVQLVGQDGNAFAIIGRCLSAMRQAGLSKEERDEFQNEATSGDYNNRLITCMEWFDVN